MAWSFDQESFSKENKIGIQDTTWSFNVTTVEENRIRLDKTRQV